MELLSIQSSEIHQHFFVTYDNVAEFKVVVGNEISTSPRLQIWLNGIKRLEQIVNTNATYSISVPQGEHQIFVDNQGIDWMRVAEYIFSNFVIAIRAYALKSSDEIIGWVHNRNFNWRYIRDIGNLPPLITDGKIFINDLIPNSIYLIEWWETQSSTISKIDTITATSSSLEINVPPFLWDYAFRMRRIGSTNVSENLIGRNNEFYLFENYPNPFNSLTRIRFYLSRATKVSMKIFNALGNEIKTLIKDEDLLAGEHEITLNASELSSGVYFCILNVNGSNQIKKMILIK